MKNHEVVPGSLVSSIAGVKPGECQKILRNLTKHRLVCYEHKKSWYPLSCVLSSAVAIYWSFVCRLWI